MQFKKDDLRDVISDDAEFLKLIENKFIDNSRWSRIYKLIFEFDGKLYCTSYRVGATEYQDESPFEYEPDLIDCVEVEKVPVTTYKYVPVKG